MRNAEVVGHKRVKETYAKVDKLYILTHGVFLTKGLRGNIRDLRVLLECLPLRWANVDVSSKFALSMSD